MGPHRAAVRPLEGVRRDLPEGVPEPLPVPDNDTVGVPDDTVGVPDDTVGVPDDTVGVPDVLAP